MPVIEIIMIPLVAVVYSVVLTDPGQLLAGVRYRAEQRLPWWLFNPLIGCYKCASGQIALWYYVVTRWGEFRPDELVAWVSASIFLSVIYNFIYEKCN